MIIVLDRAIRDDDKNRLRRFLTDKGYQVREIVGEEETIFGAVGLVRIDLREVEIQPGVVRVIPISKPYKLASRELKKNDTVIDLGPIKIGGPRIVVIAGPCAVESESQVMESAELVRNSGAVVLRGGAFKPRTSPYAFQGLGEEGLRYLKAAGERFGMPVISEIVAPLQVDLFRDYVDLYQIGARNMQNFELLKAVGATGSPVMLKRGQSARIEEWLMAAEYLLAHGTENVVLCERGIRTFETYTRNTLDISSIPVVKKLSHLPVFVDPSHATGIRDKVLPMALAAVAAGADGLMIEVHPRPEEALSDGPQSLFPVQFEKLMRDIEALSPVVGKEVSRIPHVRTKAAGGPRRTNKPRRAGEPGETGDGRMLIAFQGARGAYSEMALRRYFHNESYTPLACRHFRDVFEAVLGGDAAYGVIPIENSLAGSVHENYDLVIRYPDLKIIGETKLRVEHSLIGVPGATLEGITAVYSHPQALAQCDDYLREHATWELTPFYDTAGSVAHIADEGNPTHAAIANAQAAEVYGMAVLKEGIETNPRNYTRFVVLAGTDEAEVPDANMASLVFSTPDQPGALFAAMKIMADASLNLKKLESRPITGRPWQYMFYVDVEIPSSREGYAAALTMLEAAVEDLRVLGTYRAN